MDRYPPEEKVRYGPRGKYFTDVVPKDPQPVVITTSYGRIEGVIHVHPDHRLLDEINDGPPFIAITDARIEQPDGVIEAEFLALNRSQVLWVVPQEENEGDTRDDS